MLSSVYKCRLFFIASHPVFAVNNKQYNTVYNRSKPNILTEQKKTIEWTYHIFASFRSNLRESLLQHLFYFQTQGLVDQLATIAYDGTS